MNSTPSVEDDLQMDGQQQNMSRRSEHTTKVFVGSLPPNVTAEDLRQLFSPYGVIAECDIANRCGFLHLEDKDLAEKAIAELNNTTFMGARISVEKGRVKPRGERRMRGGMVGRGGMSAMGGMGRKRDMGPYSRDGGYGRGGGAGMQPRNGNYRDDYRGYDDYREYGRYDDRYDRRPPMYDDRRGGAAGGGYMNDRNSYGNGFERRPYDDRSGPYGGGNNMVPPRQYEDGRMAPVATGGYDDRRQGGGGMGDRRPLIDDQGMSQGQMRAGGGYDRPAQAQNDMFSRRDGPQKAISNTGYDRSTAQAASYTSYGNTSANTYGNTPPATGGGGGGGYGAPMNNYTQPMQAGSGGYGDARAAPAQGGYDTRGQAQMSNPGYASTQNAYNTAPPAGSAGGGGGYGDSYGMRAPSNTYDTAYPPLPQQRGFTGGNAAAPHRDMRAGGRF